MRWPARPTIYEVNTAVWLDRLGGVRLDEVPPAAWDALARPAVDAVWLMGVWRRSPAGLRVALADPSLGLTAADAIGSPYCVRDYTVDERFGGDDALARARAELAARGLALVLDYVPNHVAPDHPWVTEHPEYFVRTGSGEIANGRDPYFPPWPDVVQLDAFAPGLREAVAETLVKVGAQCDGLRCDMAMLLTNEVFARTWGERAGPAPAEEYWPPLIARVKAAHPDLLFMAEAYWDMEWTLQQQGFDLCYDKRLYDRLVHEGAEAVRGHLQADMAYQERLVRFIENHDEPRAAATFAPEQARAAAVVMSTLPGARLYHDGQFEGDRTHVSVFLGRSPAEPVDASLRDFYDRLLGFVAAGGLRDGAWRLCDVRGWPDNDSCRHLVAWGWDAHLVVVNLSAERAQGRVGVPWPAEEVRRIDDAVSGAVFEREGDELYVDLEPWGFHVLTAQAARRLPAEPHAVPG